MSTWKLIVFLAGTALSIALAVSAGITGNWPTVIAAVLLTAGFIWQFLATRKKAAKRS